MSIALKVIEEVDGSNSRSAEQPKASRATLRIVTLAVGSLVSDTTAYTDLAVLITEREK